MVKPRSRTELIINSLIALPVIVEKFRFIEKRLVETHEFLSNHLSQGCRAFHAPSSKIYCCLGRVSRARAAETQPRAGEAGEENGATPLSPRHGTCRRYPTQTTSEPARKLSRAIPVERFTAFQRFLSMRESSTVDLASRRFQ